MHLILDEMWLLPSTLFWPVYGLAFETKDLADWTKHVLYDLMTDPGTFIPELIGAAILIWFTVVLIRRKKMLAFFRYGHI
jgi:hypothetical protein